MTSTNYSLNPFFHVFDNSDMKNSNVKIIYLDAVVLGLDRDYYQNPIRCLKKICVNIEIM